MVMAALDKRVNLRIDGDTYDAYEKVGAFFNRTVADIMRESLQQAVPVMHMLGAVIDRAKAGDGEAVQELFDTFFKLQQGQLDMAQLTTAATLADLPKPGEKSGQD
jgi:hypothetical protein